MVYEPDPVKAINRLLLALTLLFGGAIAVAVGLLVSFRAPLEDQAFRAVQAQVLAATGLRLTVDSVGGPIWRSVILRGVRLRGGPGRSDPTVVLVPRVRVTYGVVDVLRLGPRGIRIELDDPVGVLVRDASGSLSLHPTFPQAKPGGKPPRTPPVTVVVHRGTLLWTDRYQRRQPMRAAFTGVGGQLRYADARLDFELQADHGGERWAARGLHQVATGRGEIWARIQHGDLPGWLGYLTANDLWQVQHGLADADVAASWNLADLDHLRFHGTARVTEGRLHVNGVRVPIMVGAAAGSFDEDGVTVQALSGTVAGNPFGLTGRVLAPRAWWHAPIRLQLAVRAPHVAVETLPKLLPDLALLSPSGLADATAAVTGDVLHVRVEGTAHVAGARLLREGVSGTGKFVWEHDDLRVTDVDAAVNGGRVTGRALLTGLSRVHPLVAADASFAEVDLPATLAPYVAHEPVTGRMAGHVTASGPIGALVASASARLELATVDQQPVWAAASGGFDEATGRWAIARMVAETEGGRLEGHARGSLAGPFVAGVRVAAFPLDRLERMGIPLEGKGLASGGATVEGDLAARDPLASLTAAGTVKLTDGELASQPLLDAFAAFRFGGRALALDDVRFATAGGEVRARGNLALDPAGRLAGGHLGVQATRVALGGIVPLQDLMGAKLGRIAGVADATATIALAPAAWAVGTDVRVASPSASELGAVDEVAGHVSLAGPQTARRANAPFELRLGDRRGPVTVRRGPDTVTVAGRWGDRVDLHLAGRGLGVRNWMNAVQWRSVLQGTLLAPHDRAPAIGPQREVAALPPVQGDGGGGSPERALDLPKVLEHFDTVAATPSIAPNAFLISSRPFWQQVDGALDVDLRLRGPVSAPTATLDAELGRGEAYGVPVDRLSLAATYGPHHVGLKHFDLEVRGGHSVHAAGNLEGKDGVAVDAHAIDLAWLDPWLEGAQLDLQGLADVRGVVHGPLADPRIVAMASVQGGQVNEFRYDQAAVQARVVHGRLHLDRGEVYKEGRRATVVGNLPLWTPDHALDVTVHAEGESLGLATIFAHDQVTWQGGGGTADLHLGGTLDEPDISGEATLTRAKLGIATLVAPLTDVDARVVLDSRGVVVESADALTGGGRITASGLVTMRQFVPYRLNLQIYTTPIDVALKDSFYVGRVQTALQVTGEVVHPIITGLISLPRGKVNLKGQGGGSQAGVAQAAQNALPVDFNDLSVVLGSPATTVEVSDNTLLDVNVRGTMLVDGTLADPVPRGTVNVVSGTITPVADSLRVTDGQVVFVGNALQTDNEPNARLYASLLPPTARATSSAIEDAQLDITAQTQTVDYSASKGTGTAAGSPITIIAHVSGTLGQMKISFSSPDHPDKSEDQLLAILGGLNVINAAGSAASGGANATQVAIFAGSGRLSNILNTRARPYLQSFEDALGLSDMGLRLDPDPTNPADPLALSPVFYASSRAFQTRSLGSLSLGLTAAGHASSPATYGFVTNDELGQFRVSGPVAAGLWPVSLKAVVGNDPGTLGTVTRPQQNQVGLSGLVTITHSW